MMAVSGLLLFHLVYVFLWQKFYPSFLLFDSAGYYCFTLRLHNILEDLWAGIPVFLREELWRLTCSMKWHGYFPILTTAPFCFIFGRGEGAVVLIADTLFGGILLFSVYGIGKKLHSRFAGILSAAVLSFYPLFFSHLRVYLLDLPLTAMAALSFYLMLRYASLREARYAGLLGVVLGLGLLTKFNFLLFVAVPLAFVFRQAFSAVCQKLPAASRGSSTAKNALIVLATAGGLSFGFYLLKFREMAFRVYEASYLRFFQDGVYSSFWALVAEMALTTGRFLRLLATSGLSVFFSAALCAAVPLFLKSEIKKEEKTLLLLSAVVPFAVLVLLFRAAPSLLVRYAMPVLPLLAVMTGIACAGLRNIFLRKAAACLLLSCGIFQFFILSYPGRATPADILSSASLCPLSYDKTQDVLNQIFALENEDTEFEILFLDDVPEILYPLESTVHREHRMVRIKRPPRDTEDFYRTRGASPGRDAFLTTDYVVLLRTAAGEKSESTAGVNKASKHAREIVFHRPEAFALVQTISLGGSNALLIFKNKFKDSATASLERGFLRFLFEKGRGRIFWKTKEITSGPGLSVSFFYDGEWHGSGEAVWNVERHDNHRLSLAGYWPDSPLRQRWDIELTGDGAIAWKVAAGGYKNTRLTGECMVLAVTAEYENWFAEGAARGRFQEKTKEFLWKKNWAGVAPGAVGVERRAAGEAPRPAVFFLAAPLPPGFSYFIAHANQLTQDRELGCFRIERASRKGAAPSERLIHIRISP